MKFITLFMLSTLSLFAESTQEQLVEQWLKTERLIEQESADWDSQRQHSQRLLSLYDKELVLLDEELSQSGNNAELVDAETEQLKQSLAASETTRRRVIAHVAKLRPQVLDLLKKLPTPLQEQLKDQAFTLENKVSNTSVDAMLRAITKIYQESERFNRNYVFEEHPIEINGESLRAKVIYLGLSHALFIAGDLAGEARPSDQNTGNWIFSERPEMKKNILSAFAVHEKEIASSLFEIPLKLTTQSHE
ncbi:MAG: DUF3450 family protein [Akkermansiaceae bacterium]